MAKMTVGLLRLCYIPDMMRVRIIRNFKLFLILVVEMIVLCYCVFYVSVHSLRFTIKPFVYINHFSCVLVAHYWLVVRQTPMF